MKTTPYDIQLKAGARRSIEEAISEAERELQVRERCYARWITDGKLSKVDARDRTDRLQAAVQYLKYLLDWIVALEQVTLSENEQFHVQPHPPQTGGIQDSAQCG